MKNLLVPLSFAGVLVLTSVGLTSCGGDFKVNYNVSSGAMDVAARVRLETFLKEELARLKKGPGADLAVIQVWCTGALTHLLEIEEARGKAYDEGFAAAKGDPANVEKPLFADSGYFIGATIEGDMSAQVEWKSTENDRMKFEVKFTSVADGKSYDQGRQMVLMVQEKAVWKIADVEFSDGMTLTKMLKRPKYMEPPAEGAK